MGSLLFLTSSNLMISTSYVSLLVKIILPKTEGMNQFELQYMEMSQGSLGLC
jgi:hypothetical protein